MNENATQGASPASPRVFPNYRALCTALGLPVKTGGAKLKQLHELSELFVITKIGNTLELKPKGDLPTSDVSLLLSDASAPESVFGDRKVLFLRMVWERLERVADGRLSVDSFATPEAFRDDKENLVFFPEEVCTYLNLVQDSFFPARDLARQGKSEARGEAEALGEAQALLWTLNEISAQNRAVLSSLFSHLFGSTLVSGFRSYRISLQGVELTCTAEDALLITEVREHLLADLGCKTTYEVHLRGKDSAFYPELARRLYNLYGIRWFEECFVVRTSEFLLSRFILRNLSRAQGAAVLRGQSNHGMVQSLEKRITREVGRLHEEASGWDNIGAIADAQALRSKADTRQRVFRRTVAECVASA